MPISPRAASCGHQFSGKVLRLIPLAHVRADFGLGELADAAAQQLLLRGQTKVHRRSDSTIMDSMRPIRTLAIAAGVIVCLRCPPRPARADATAFIGANTTPSNRPVKGFAVGFGLLIVAFEFEYADHERGRARRRRRRR